MMRSIVVLPQPDGPTSTPTSPWRSEKATLPRTSRQSPAAVRYAFRATRTSSGPDPPLVRASFKGLHQQDLNCQYHGDEGERIGQDTCHIEQLEGNADLESDPVRPPQQFDHQHDLPHQRQP